MADKTLFMETTSISPVKTASEITTLLIESGARQISLQYDEKGALIGLCFVLVVRGMPFPFQMPVRVSPVAEHFKARRVKAHGKYGAQKFEAADKLQAERVAWRQLLRWIQAQLAMIGVGMVSAEEIFLPYLQNPDGRTVYEMFTETRFKALPAPGESNV